MRPAGEEAPHALLQASGARAGRHLAYAGRMNKGTLWTIVGVVVAVVIAWVLVNVLFSLIAFAFKLLAVAVVAVIVYFVLRSVFRRAE